MSTLLSKIVADFTTQLATAISTGGTTASLQSATDDDGVALPTGQYLLTIDGNNSQKEYWLCNLNGTSLTAIQNVSRQGARTAGCIRDHRVGASVSITDFAHILYINDLLTGTTNLNASTPLGYDGTASILTANQLATKAYVDGVAIAGSPDASTTVKGISKLSSVPVSPTDPIAVGDNDPRVPTQSENDALVGTVGTPSSTNKFVTNDDTATTGASTLIRAKANGQIDEARLALTTAGDTVYSDGTDLQRLAIGASGQVLGLNSSGTAPAWNYRGNIAFTTFTGTEIAETTKYTLAIPANTLLSGRGFRIVLFGTAQYTGTAYSSTIRAKFDGNLLASVGQNAGSGTSYEYQGFIDTIATSNTAQSSASFTSASQASTVSFDKNTSATNATLAKNLTLTFARTSGSGTPSVTVTAIIQVL